MLRIGYGEAEAGLGVLSFEVTVHEKRRPGGGV